ncbi:hypothetical protein [Steroidobacter agaridevorans]|uniref:hypothetical protein n=1 Tax=Steroidobacter agaridevorans TaxID=2695856 RepID=UPI00137ABD20|nr:hypothetical protein [Steroidobacter agaridevorans]
MNSPVEEMELYWGERERRVGYWWSVMSLVGHLIGTALIFTALFSVGWLVSVFLHTLHRHHPFPDEIFRFVTKIELYLVYADTALSAVILMVGMVRFCRQVLEVER